MPDFLLQEFLRNRLLDIFLFLGIMLLVVILSGPLVKLINALIHAAVKRFSKYANQDKQGSYITNPTRVFIILLSLIFSLNLLSFPFQQSFSIFNFDVLDAGKKLLITALLLVMIWLAMRLIDYITHLFQAKALETLTKEDDQLAYFLKDVFKVSVIIVGILFILGNIYQLNISSLIATAGIAALAIALAAKESLENLLGSFTIFIEKPFTVGDLIRIKDTEGVVEKVGFRSTRLRTSDKTFVTVPNRDMITNIIDNRSLRTGRRVKIYLGLTYATSSLQIKAISDEVIAYLSAHPEIEEDCAVGLHNFGESSLNILVQYNIKPTQWAHYVSIREENNFKIMSIVENHGANFAFPTQTIHIQKDNSAEKAK